MERDSSEGLRLLAEHLAKVKLEAEEARYLHKEEVLGLQQQIAEMKIQLKQYSSDVSEYKAQVTSLERQGTRKALFDEREQWKKLVGTLRKDKNELKRLADHYKTQADLYRQSLENAQTAMTRKLESPVPVPLPCRKQKHFQRSLEQQKQDVQDLYLDVNVNENEEKEKSKDQVERERENENPMQTQRVRDNARDCTITVQSEGKDKADLDVWGVANDILIPNIRDISTSANCINKQNESQNQSKSNRSRSSREDILDDSSTGASSTEEDDRGRIDRVRGSHLQRQRIFSTGCVSPARHWSSHPHHANMHSSSPPRNRHRLQSRGRTEASVDKIRLDTEISLLRTELARKEKETKALRSKLDLELEMKWERLHEKESKGSWRGTLFDSFKEVLAPSPNKNHSNQIVNPVPVLIETVDSDPDS